MTESGADATIEELTGIAVGCIGMSLDDFCRCTPAEFYSIYKQWEVQHVRQPWERARFMACAMLQPYSKKAMKAADVCRFAWEDAGSERDGAHTESSRERFEEIRRRGGG